MDNNGAGQTIADVQAGMCHCCLHRRQISPHRGPYNSSIKDNDTVSFRISRVGISGTTAKSRKRKFVPSSHPGPFAVVASSRKSQTIFR